MESVNLIRRCAFVVFLAISPAPATALSPNKIRGANYVPSYASTDVGIWLDYDPEVIERELGYAKRLKLNSVRVFLQFVVYEDDPDRFLKRLDDFVDIAARHGIRPMFVLFDSCFGDEPSLEKAHNAMWVNNPGYSRIAASDWLPLEKYVADVVNQFRDDERVLMWDIMNEPMADFNHVTREERDRVWKFCRHFCRFVKENDPSHPITVGHAAVEYVPKTADLVDVISIHSYAVYPGWLQEEIDVALHYGRESGKPVIFTEFGNPGAGQPYEMALEVIERNGMGFYFWELMIAKVMFNDMAGLIYPDGTARDLGPIAALLGGTAPDPEAAPRETGGFFLKTTGGIPLKQAPDQTALRDFLAAPENWEPLLAKAEAAPRNRGNIVASLPALAHLGRKLSRPDPEAGEIFELALSIPHHFRLGREELAVERYQELLGIVIKLVDGERVRLDRR